MPSSSGYNIWPEYIVIVVYLIAIVLISIAFKKLNKNTDDYFRSGGRASWWLVGFSSFITSITAITFTANSGVAFKAGWSAIYIYVGSSIGLVINALFLAAWFRQIRVTTLPELVRLRFGKSFQQFVAYYSIFNGIVGSAIPLWGLAIFCSPILGIPIHWIIIILGGITMLYSATGGSWAIMGTDFIQGMILLPTTVLLSILCLVELGGIGNFFNMIQERGLADEFALVKSADAFPDGTYALVWIVAIVVVRIMNETSSTSSMRYFATKDGREAKKAAWLSLVLKILGVAFWFIPAMTARLIWENQVMAQQLSDPAEAAYSIASMNLLPAGVIGLMIVTMLSATMSTMDSGLNRNAAIVVLDIYPAVMRRLKKIPRSAEQLVLASQFITLVFGCFIIMVAIWLASFDGAGMFKMMFRITAMLALPVMTPLLLGLFIRKTPPWSGFFSFCASLVPSVISLMATEPWSLQKQLLINIIVGVLAFVATIPFYKMAPQESRQQVQDFFTRMHTPVDFEKESGHSEDENQLRILGRTSVIIGTLIFCIILIAGSNTRNWLCIGFIGGSINIAGLLLLHKARNLRRKTLATHANLP